MTAPARNVWKGGIRLAGAFDNGVSNHPHRDPARSVAAGNLPLRDLDATLVMVGQIGTMEGFDSAPLVFGRRHITGSPVGGIAQTQEILDICADKGILPECE